MRVEDKELGRKGKRKPHLTDERLRDIWNVRGLDHVEAELEDFDKLLSSAVARCLKEDDDSRDELAKTLSSLLNEHISVAMLDSYTSEARREHKIPASRFLTLIAVTRRFDILDAVLREIGGKALDRQGAKILRVGMDYAASVRAARVLRESVETLFAPLEP